jgi:hypothetical protein
LPLELTRREVREMPVDTGKKGGARNCVWRQVRIVIVGRVDFPIRNRIQKMTSWIRSEGSLAFEIRSIQRPITHVQYQIDSLSLSYAFISLIWGPHSGK